MVSKNQRSKTETAVTLSDADKIDLLCDAFEEAWAAGNEPSIEEYLTRCEEQLRERLLKELLLVDCELRAKRGDSINRQMYERRFPGHSKLIAGLPFETAGMEGSGVLLPRTSSVLGAGSRIAHFELLEEIGWGAFGMVWRARDERLDRIVAVKFPAAGAAYGCRARAVPARRSNRPPSCGTRIS